MNRKINILILMSVFFIITAVLLATGSHVYDKKTIARGLNKYKMNHMIYSDSYKGLVKVNTMKSVGQYNEESIIGNINICYDGIYYVHLNTYYKYIKFYDDNTVITFTTNCSPDQVIQWDEKHLEGSPKGKINIKDGNIQFTTVQEKPEGYSVKVTYTGNQKSNTLYLHSKSLSTDNESCLEYFYYEK